MRNTLGPEVGQLAIVWSPGGTSDTKEGQLAQ